jgi:hypothetical protein
LINPYGNGALSLQIDRSPPITALSKADAADIFEANEAPVGQSFDDKVFKFSLAAQATVGFDGKAEKLSWWSRCAAKSADGRQNVLLDKRCADIRNREIGLLQLLRIHPQAIGQLAASEYTNISHAGNRAERFSERLFKPAWEEGGNVEILWMTKAQDHQEIARGATHAQPLAGYGLR